MDLTSMEMAAGLSRMCSQSTPCRKKARALMSSKVLTRWSWSVMNLKRINNDKHVQYWKKGHLVHAYRLIVSFADSEIGTSGGNTKDSLQFMILRWVS